MATLVFPHDLTSVYLLLFVFWIMRCSSMLAFLVLYTTSVKVVEIYGVRERIIWAMYLTVPVPDFVAIAQN
jgi:hypothetical protein